jgi:hypothetical protein
MDEQSQAGVIGPNFSNIVYLFSIFFGPSTGEKGQKAVKTLMS